MNWWSIFRKVGIILLLLTIPFWIWDIDIYLESRFYDPSLGGWFMKEDPMWDALYKYGVFPGFIVAIISLFAVSLSYWSERNIPLRKPALLMVLSLILGPGLIVNAILKDNYGRPRPGQVETFGGTEAYLAVLVPGSGSGKSFPCGHCSIAFYLALPFLFLNRTNKWLAYTILILGTLFGLWMSMARMVVGGHFLSDALWAGGIVWLTGIAVAGLLKLNEPITKKPSKKQAMRMTILVGILLPIITLGSLLATPYTSTKETLLTKDQRKNMEIITTSFDQANITIRRGKDFQVKSEVTGFGFPNSRVFQKWNPNLACLTFEEAGMFTELAVSTQLSIPDDVFVVVELNAGTIKQNGDMENVEYKLGDEAVIITD